jgi:hypothetical protein
MTVGVILRLLLAVLCCTKKIIFDPSVPAGKPTTRFFSSTLIVPDQANRQDPATGPS